jgi:hypothetical protein
MEEDQEDLELEDNPENEAFGDLVQTLTILGKGAVTTIRKLSTAYNSIIEDVQKPDSEPKEIKNNPYNSKLITRFLVETMATHNISDSIRITKEHFNLPESFSLEIKLKVSFKTP